MRFGLFFAVCLLFCVGCIPPFPTARFSPTSAILTSVEFTTPEGGQAVSVCTVYVDEDDRSLGDGSANPDGSGTGNIGPDALQLNMLFDWDGDSIQYVLSDASEAEIYADVHHRISEIAHADESVAIYSAQVGPTEYLVVSDGSLTQRQCEDQEALDQI